MNLIYIQTLITKYKYYLLFMLAILYFSGILGDIFGLDFLNSNTFAETTTGANSASDQEKAASLVKAYNVIIMMASLIINFLTILIGWFLSPVWTMGDIIGIRPMLHNIWILMSNIMYILFGIATILIAFMNIFGFADGSSYDIKKALPRLIVGVAMVPATWFIVSAVVSVSNVLTAAVIRLPYETIMAVGDDEVIKRMNKVKVPSAVYIDLEKGNNKPILSCRYNSSTKQWENNPDWPTFAVSAGAKLPESANGQLCIPLVDFMMGDGAYNILLLYTYMVLSMDDLKEISTNTGTGTDEEVLTNTVFDIVKKLLLGALFIIVYAILIFALFIVLFVRAVYLWIYIMISPIFGLLYFLGDKSGAVKESLGNFTLTKFVSLAMVPVYVAAALSFGFVFLMITGATKGIDFEKSNTVEHLTILDSFNIEIKTGMTPGSTSITGTTTELMQTTIGYIIMNLFSIILLWIVVMAAFKSDDITRGIVQPLISLGSSVKNLAAKAPTMIPIIPGSGMSLANIGAGGANFANTITSAADNKGRNLGSEWGGGVATSMGLMTDQYMTALKKGNLDLANEIDKTSKNSAQAGNEFDRIAQTYFSHNDYDLDKMYEDAKGRSEISEAIKQITGKPVNITNAASLAKAIMEAEKSNKYIFNDDKKDHAIYNKGITGFKEMLKVMKDKNTTDIRDYGTSKPETTTSSVKSAVTINSTNNNSFTIKDANWTEEIVKDRIYLKDNKLEVMDNNKVTRITLGELTTKGLGNKANSVDPSELNSADKESLKKLRGVIQNDENYKKVIKEFYPNIDASKFEENKASSLGNTGAEDIALLDNNGNSTVYISPEAQETIDAVRGQQQQQLAANESNNTQDNANNSDDTKNNTTNIS